MTLLQIHEPGQSPKPHQSDDNIAVGIDLGTTNSLVAFSKSEKSEILRDENGEGSHPSVVSYDALNNVRTGLDAIKNGENLISSIKRLMGRGVEDIKKISGKLQYDVLPSENDKMVRLNVHGRAVSPVEVSSEILKSLKKTAEKSLSQNITKAVITVPAYFDDGARHATKDAAKLAGLEVLRLVNEPTAAALAYGLDKGSEGIYAVYDLGGGTFDVSILRMEAGVFQVLATGGSDLIGGDDFDREIAEIILWQHKMKQDNLPDISQTDLHNILIQSRKIKEELTDKESGIFSVEIAGDKADYEISRARIEESIKPYTSATIDIFKQAINDADIELSDIEGVVLVGGATRTPLVRQTVKEFTNQEPLCDINPDEVVALGAALQAEGLTAGSSNLLLDVLPLSLGIETVGGIVEKVINRNSPIPVAKAQEFTTYKDGQTAMSIHAVQGEREMATQNRSLAKFNLTGIPPMVAGAARIKVTFSVDADGLLTVSAEEETTGKKQIVEAKPSYGISNEEIRSMLYESMAHAKNDMQMRLLTESKVESEGIIMTVKAAIEVDGDMLSSEEKQAIDSAIEKLQSALSSDDKKQIDDLKDKLSNATNDFAARRMDKYIGDSLKGENVDKI